MALIQQGHLRGLTRPRARAMGMKVKNMTKTDYQTNAEQFLDKHGIRFSVEYVDNSCPLFCDGKHIHGAKHKVTLKRGKASISFYFWNSYNDKQAGIKPSAYDVLACASSDINCPDTFEDFCGEFGYDTDSRKAETTFRACRVQAEKLRRIFDSEEIQAELGTIN